MIPHRRKETMKRYANFLSGFDEDGIPNNLEGLNHAILREQYIKIFKQKKREENLKQEKKNPSIEKLLRDGVNAKFATSAIPSFSMESLFHPAIFLLRR